MSITQNELATQFAEQNPKAGSFEEGVVDYDQVKQLNEILTGKIRELSREKALSDQEISFIQRSADLGARSIQYLIERMGMPLPNNDSTRDHIRTIAHTTGLIEGSWEGLPNSAQVIETPARLVDLLATLPAGAISIRRLPHLRAPIEDYAIASLDLLTDMADYTGGLKIDHYLQGNLQNIIAHYELIETA